MATTSYGSITIVDITDIGEFSVYPTANSPRTQIYNPDTGAYIPDWSGDNPDTSLKITPVAYYASQNVSTSATYTWKRRDGAGNLTDLGANESVITVGGNTGVLQVTNNILGDSTSGIVSYVVTAHYTVDNVPLEATGEIDFSLTRQGSVARTVSISGESIFKYNAAGALTPSGKTINLSAKVAGVSLTTWQYKNGNSWSTYPGSTSGSNSLTVSPSDNVFTNDVATIRVNTNDNTVYDIFTITKLYDGVKGDSVISAVLTNEDQMLPADKNGKVTAYNGADTTLTIYEGGQDITSTWTISKTYSPSSISSLDTAVNNYNATFSSTSVSDTTFNNIDTAFVTFTCNKSGYDPIVQKFSLVKVKTGQDGVTPIIYSLEPTTVVVNTDPLTSGVHPNPNPSSVTFNAYKQDGNTKTAYAGRIQFYIDNSSSISEATTTDAATRTINFNSSPWNAANRVKAVLYQAGANTVQLDSQTVVVVCDGDKGDTGDDGHNGFGAVNVIIDNEADVIPCDSSNHPLSQFVIDIAYQGYQGTTTKTTSVSAPNLSATDFGSAIVPDTSTAGHVKYTIPTTATLVANGTVQLQFTVAAQDYDNNGNVINQNVTISKLYSWTRSSAAVNGTNATILQLTTPNGTIIENGSGTLYAQGILYDGSSEATGETYTWYQYKNNSYVLIDNATSGSSTPGVRTGHLSGTTWTNGTNGSSNTTSDMIKITPDAVDGYASFKVVSAYTINGQSKSFTQYVSVIDKTDPIQVSVHSTVGDQIKNGQGIGCIYARVTQNGVQIDEVPMNIQAGTSYPSSPTTGDMYVLLSTESTKSSRTATLMEYNGTTWVAQYGTCKYEWTFRNKDNTPVTTNVPYQHTVEADKNKNQFIYIDSSLVNGKITVDVKVTIN